VQQLRDPVPALAYACPMHPKISPRCRAICPICGMALVAHGGAEASPATAPILPPGSVDLPAAAP
jgi:hypothetical protein